MMSFNHIKQLRYKEVKYVFHFRAQGKGLAMFMSPHSIEIFINADTLLELISPAFKG